MKRILGVFSMTLLTAGFLAAQIGRPAMMEGAESTDPTSKPKVIGDITERTTTMEKRVLPYDHLREADIMWEKRIWRVIDTREKMNLVFSYEERPFIDILVDGIKSGELDAFLDEDFKTPVDTANLSGVGATTDTVYVMDPVTYERVPQVVTNEVKLGDMVQRYRVKEVWYFDKELSTLQVRILGIAPLVPRKSEASGEILGDELPFWVYYASAREYLARERVFSYGNNASPITWEDLMEMRYFSSYIYKEADVKNRRIKDYLDNGVDQLQEAERIKNVIFNFEQDLWEY